MPTPRRDFLGWLGSASLLGLSAKPAFAADTHSPHNLRTPEHAEPVAETWDMSWTTRVSGQYKAVFDSPEAAGGAALYRAVAWCEQYKEVYGAARPAMSPVVVLRHKGFYLAMNNDFWALHDVGKRVEERDERGKKWAKVNPVAPLTPPTKPEDARFTLAGFIADGGIVLGCGWSFGGAVSMVAKAEKLEKDAARARAKELLIPGVILQPNGIFAALRAQEAGCSYVMAS
jgi:hypothetical protein